MTTYSLAGAFGWAGGGKAGATVDIWATSRFVGIPSMNEDPPSGNPDAGPVITGPNFGSPGAYEITGIVTLQDYYVRIQYGGETNWGTRTAASLGGVGGAGDVLTVFGRTGNVTGQGGDYTVAEVTGAAPLASPALTGSPTAPTQTTGDSSTKIATDAFVANSITGLATTTALSAETARAEAAEALLAPKASPALTGTPTAPTPSGGDNTTKLATTAFVETAIAPKAPLASPALTGVPTAPTAAPLTDNTQLATTAYTDLAVAAATPGVAAGADVLTTESTTGTGYGDLATPGPAVTLVTGTRAKVEITFVGSITLAGFNSNMSFAVSGATAIAANDQYSAAYASFLAATNASATWVGTITGLTPGTNTFTAKYRTGGSTADFSFRYITVTSLP